MKKGYFEKGDVVDYVIGMKKLENGKVEVLVQWKTRPESLITPESTHVKFEEAKEKIPQHLIDFYESIIKF